MTVGAGELERASPRQVPAAGLALAAVTLLASLSAARMLVLHRWRGIESAPAELLWSGVLDWGLWLPLAPLVWWLGGRLPLAGRPRTWIGRALLHALLSLVCSAAQLTAFALASRALRETPGDLVRALQTAALVKLHAGVLVYWALVLARQALDTSRRARAAELARARLDEQLARARLDVLQAHLRPHFLFNTLNAVAALMRRDPDAAETMLARLGDLLRRSLAEPGDGEVRLEEELDFLERYLDIERARLGERLAVHVDVPAELLDARVPPLLLQPLVENAVLHGVAARAAGGRVSVSARREGPALVLLVEDEPRSSDTPADAPPTHAGSGLGLAGTRERLTLRYGQTASLRVAPRAAGGTRVELRLPLEETPS